MSNLEDLLKKDKLQTLNSDTVSRFGIRKNKFTEGSFESVAAAIGKIYSDALSDDSESEYQARCLAASYDYTGKIPGEVNNEGDDSKALVKVIARIPKLHAAIPKPEGEFCELQKNLAIMMHPIFYARQGSDSSLPQPGNIIRVRFFTHGQGQYGQYIGIIDPNQIAATTSPPSARNLVNCANTGAFTLEEYASLSNREREALRQAGVGEQIEAEAAQLAGAQEGTDGYE